MPDDTPPSGAIEEDAAPYSLEVLARLSGVSCETILRYHEQGLLPEAAEFSSGSAPEFDAATLLTLRRIEHLRLTCGANVQSLRLMAGMLQEIERLRRQLRLQR